MINKITLVNLWTERCLSRTLLTNLCLRFVSTSQGLWSDGLKDGVANPKYVVDMGITSRKMFAYVKLDNIAGHNCSLSGVLLAQSKCASSTTAARCSPSWNLSVGIFLLRLRHYALFWISTEHLWRQDHTLTHHTRKPLVYIINSIQE